MAHDVNLSEQEVAVELPQAVKESIGEERYELWLGEAQRWKIEGGRLEVTFPNEFAATLATKRVLEDVTRAVEAWRGHRIEVCFAAEARLPVTSPTAPSSAPSRSPTVPAPIAKKLSSASENGIAPSFADGSPIASPHATDAAEHAHSHSHDRAQTGVERLAQRRQILTAEPSSAKDRQTEGNEKAGKNRKDKQRTTGVEVGRSTSGAGSDCEPTVPRGITTGGSGVETGFAPSSSSPPAATESVLVVSECNQLAWSTAKLVLGEPGRYSPVLFFGPSGCGKSLLMATVASQLRRRCGMRRVQVVTSEQFTNDFTSGLCGRQLPMFRDKYRGVDALLVEDVQFLMGKRSTLNEFRYTIDNLVRRGKQVVLTADRPLSELHGLGKQLVGRLQAGLTAPLLPLDESARRRALQHMLDGSQVRLPADIVEQLAARASGDGRVLSGIAKRLIAHARLSTQPLTWEACWEAVADLVHAVQPVVKIKDIERAVCSVFGLEPGSLQSQSKTRRVSQPRMIAMFLARKYTPAAYKEIGQYFGKRRHSTVIAAQRSVEQWLQENAPLECAGGLPVRELLRHTEAHLQVS